LETWRRRRGTSLTLKGYSESGGVQRAIARTADRVFDTELDTEQREMARNIFLRLTELGEGTQDMRRRVSLREIVPEDAERSIAVRAVLQRLADRRLVTVAESTVEVAHEALIREWPRLREWLDEDRAGLRVHRRLTEAAHEWERLGRDDGALLRGVRLAEAVEWRQHNEASLNPLEREFMRASEALAIAERVSRERSRRRLSVAAVGLSIVFLAVAAAAGLQWMRAEEQRNIAEGERSVALARQLAVQAEANEGQDDLALLLAVEGYRDADVPETRSSLLGRLVSNPALTGFLPGHSAEVLAIAFGPDDQTLVSSSGSTSADVRLWDLTAGRQLGDAIRSDPAGVGVTLDPAGKWVAWAAPEGIKVRDRVAGTTRSGPRPTHPLEGAVVYRGDTNSFLTTDGRGEVTEWDFETLALRGTLVDAPDTSSDHATAMSRDGHWYLVGGEDGAISAWDLSEPQPHKVVLRDRHEGSVPRPPMLAVSRNGTSLAALDISVGKNVLTLWDIPGRKRRARIVLEQGSEIITMAMSAAGDLLAIGRLDGTIELLDMLTANPRGALAGYEEPVTALVFDDTGNYLASGYDDGRLALWRPAADTRLDASIALPAEINIPTTQRVAISPDAGRLAVIESNESVAVWNLTTGALVNRIRVPNGIARMTFGTPVVGIPVAISGNIMVVLDSTGIKASVWDLAQGSLVGELAPPDLVQAISAVAIDPGGRTVAFSAGAEIFVMIVGQEEPMLQISVDRGRVPNLFVSSLAFSADGSVLAVGTDGGPEGGALISTFDTLSGAPVGKTVLVNADAAGALAFTSDKRNVAVVTRRGEAPRVTSEVLLVDTERGLPIGKIGRLAAERFAQSLAYDRRTGAIISSRLADGEMAGWTVEPDAWARLACRIANRNLATEEWGRFVGLGPYEATCPDVADASR
jgi:WD40 repeat protein